MERLHVHVLLSMLSGCLSVGCSEGGDSNAQGGEGEGGGPAGVEYTRSASEVSDPAVSSLPSVPTIPPDFEGRSAYDFTLTYEGSDRDERVGKSVRFYNTEEGYYRERITSDGEVEVEFDEAEPRESVGLCTINPGDMRCELSTAGTAGGTGPASDGGDVSFYVNMQEVGMAPAFYDVAAQDSPASPFQLIMTSDRLDLAKRFRQSVGRILGGGAIRIDDCPSELLEEVVGSDGTTSRETVRIRVAFANVRLESASELNDDIARVTGWLSVPAHLTRSTGCDGTWTSPFGGGG